MEDATNEKDKGGVVKPVKTTGKDNQRQKRVHFSKPIAKVRFVSMSKAAMDARKSDWIRVAADNARFQRRISELEPTIRRCFDHDHRCSMRNYINSKLERGVSLSADLLSSPSSPV